MKLSLLLAASLVSSSAYAASQAAFSAPRIYLHPSPPTKSTPLVLSENQAQAVIAHHLGTSKDVVLSDMEDGGSDEWDDLLTDHSLFEETGWQDGKGKVLIIQGIEDPEDVIPTSLLSAPTFLLSSTASVKSLLAPFLAQAKTYLSHVLESIKSIKIKVPNFLLDLFDLNSSEAAAALHSELSALTSWVEGLVPSYPSSPHSASYEAISIQGLEGLSVSSSEYKAGRDVVQASISSMKASMVPFIIIVTPPGQSTQHYPSHSSHSKRVSSDASILAKNTTGAHLPGSVFSTTTCFASLSACTNATNACSGHGTCGPTTKAGKTCYTCSCGSTVEKSGRINWSGTMCEKEDISSTFVLIIFTIGLLVLLSAGSIGLLYSADQPLPSVLGGGSVAGSKRD